MSESSTDEVGLGLGFGFRGVSRTESEVYDKGKVEPSQPLGDHRSIIQEKTTKQKRMNHIKRTVDLQDLIHPTQIDT